MLPPTWGAAVEEFTSSLVSNYQSLLKARDEFYDENQHKFVPLNATLRASLLHSYEAELKSKSNLAFDAWALQPDAMERQLSDLRTEREDLDRSFAEALDRKTDLTDAWLTTDHEFTERLHALKAQCSQEQADALATQLVVVVYRCACVGGVGVRAWVGSVWTLQGALVMPPFLVVSFLMLSLLSRSSFPRFLRWKRTASPTSKPCSKRFLATPAFEARLLLDRSPYASICVSCHAPPRHHSLV